MNKKLYFVSALLLGLLPMSAQKPVEGITTPPKSELTTVKPAKASELPEVALMSDKKELDNRLKEYSYTEEYKGNQHGILPENSSTHIKIEYDNKGRAKSIDYGDHKQHYSYVDGADGVWTERVISDENNGTTTPTTKEARTIGSDGTVLTLDSYSYDVNNQTWTKSNSRVWFAPTKQYLESQYSDGNLVSGYEIDGNSYVYTEKRIDESGNWYVSRKSEYAYTSDGVETLSESLYYSQDGTVSSGSKVENLLNQPQAGYITKTTYNYQNNAWVGNYREVYTANFNAPYINDGKHRERTYYDFDSATNEWVKGDWIKQDWIQHPTLNVLREEEKDGKFLDTCYRIYDAEGNEFDSYTDFVCVNSDNSYVLSYYIDYHDDDDRYFSFYDVNGNETRRIHQKSVEGGYYGILSYEEYKDGTWQPLVSADITMGEYHFKTNEKGWATYYQDDELYKTYTYSENGVHFERYDHDGGDNNETYKYEDYTATKGDDGLVNVIAKWYDFGNPIATYMEKYIIYPDGKEYYAEYFSENDEKPYSEHLRVSDLVSTDEKGVTTTIHRSLDDNQKVVETTKTVSYTNGETSVKEEYTKTDGAWIPQTKTENGKDGIVSWTITYVSKNDAWVPQTKTESSDPEKPEFDYIMPKDPLADLGLKSSSVLGSNYEDWWNKPDTYAKAAPTISSSKKRAKSSVSTHDIIGVITEPTCRKSYTWDEASSKWVLDENASHIVEYVADETSYQSTMQQASYKQIKGLKRDDRHRLLESSQRRVQPGKDDVIENYAYEYAGDNLVKATHTQSYGEESLVECHTYVYGKSSTDGISHISNSSQTVRLHVVGKTIYADSSKSLTLYAADGKLVAQGQNGEVTAPASGMYVVSADGVKVKVAIK